MNNNISLLERTHPDLLSGNNNVDQVIIKLYNLYIQFKNAQEKNDLSDLAKLYIREFKDKDLQTFNICKKVADACSEENEAIGNCGITAAMETLYNNNEEFLKKYDKYILDKGKNKKLCDMDEHCFNKFFLGFKQQEDDPNKKAQNNRYYNGYCAEEIWNVLNQLNNNMEIAKNNINGVLPSGKRYYCAKSSTTEKKAEIQNKENEKFDAMKAKAIETGGIIAEIRYDILNALQDMAKKYDELIKNDKKLEDVLKEEVNLLKSYCEIKSIDKNNSEESRTKLINELLACDKSIYLSALGLGLSKIHKKTIFILDNSEGKSKLWVFDASKIDDKECNYSTISVFDGDIKNISEKKIKLAQHYKNQIDDPSNPILFYDEEGLYGGGHFRYLDPNKIEERKIFKMHMSNLFLDECIKKNIEQQKRDVGIHKTITDKQAGTIKDLKEQEEKLKSENNNLKNQIDKLKNEKINLESQAKSNKNPNEETKKHIVELEELQRSLQKKIKEQEETINIFQTANNDLEKFKNKFEKENQNLKLENDGFKNKLLEKQKIIDENVAIKKELEETNKKLESENDKLEKQLLEKQKLIDENATIKKELEETNKKLESENDKLEKQLLEKQKLIDENATIKKELEETNKKLESENDKLEKQLLEKQKLINENAAIKKELEETNKLKGEIEEENKKLKSENDDLKNQLSEKQKFVNDAVKAREEALVNLEKIKSEKTKQEQTIKTLNNKLKKLADEQKKQAQNQTREFFKQAAFTNFTARKFSLIYFFAWLFQCIPCFKRYIDRIRTVRNLNNKFDAFRNSLFLKNTDDIEKEMNKNIPKQADEIFDALDKFLPICQDISLFDKYMLIYCNLLDLYPHDTRKIYEALNNKFGIGFNGDLLKGKIDQLKLKDNEIKNDNNINNENENIIDTHNLIREGNKEEPRSGAPSIGDEKNNN